MTMSVLEAILDEVALEGLDGVTPSALWLRLQKRVPSFPLKLDSSTKQFIWQSLIVHPDLDFYQLPEERDPLVVYDRYKEKDQDLGVLNTEQVYFTEDLYPVNIIANNKNGIQGSCCFFKERVLVTDQIRMVDVVFEEAFKRWGEKLVIVGSQVLRSNALFGTDGDTSLELPDCSYCILEKLGRSRWQGELQKDLQGAFKRNKYDILTEKICSLLSDCNNQMETLLTVREELCVPECTFKRLYHYMASAGIIKLFSRPLHEIQPCAEPCKTKKGTDIMVRCMKLIKDSKRKHEGFDDNDEIKTPVTPVDIIYEKDILSQTYELIENRGTKGISQREIGIAMNVGKLEARMLCRLLERYKLVKGFMEDEGRQRTTKFISHVFVEDCDLRKQLLEEKAKSEKLSMSSFAPQEKENLGKAALKDNEPFEMAHCELFKEGIENSQSRKKRNRSEANLTQSQVSTTSMPRAGAKVLFCKDTDKEFTENDYSLDSFQLESNLCTLSADEDDASVIEEVLEEGSGCKKSKNSNEKVSERCRETYRLLKRRNIIVEAVKNLRLVESLFTLQKMIMEQEKQEGVPTRCCKKSILRLVQRLSQEGLVRLYRTTVMQDGISKKVEFIVHPSINPNDPLVKSSIEQIRFRISNSTSSNRARSPQGPSTPNKQETGNQTKERAKEKLPKSLSCQNTIEKTSKSHDQMDAEHLLNCHPVIVPGLGRTNGYLPKMPRLKVTHIFLWYIVYGHPFYRKSQEPFSDEIVEYRETAENANLFPETTPCMSHPETAQTMNPFANAEVSMSDLGAEENTGTVYVDESSWMRFVPPATEHSEYGHGWVLVSDILLCLPLSIFIQIVQVSYKVDNLEDYLNHPIKKHTLIKYLPRSIRQQLLYKRRYVFSVYQGLQKLSCMGLIQFGPSEKFQEKDQVFVYVKKKTTVVDTIACDPHYNLAQGSYPFEKRFYVLETIQDVDNYWFDLQYVCLNTPLGVIRCTNLKKSKSQSSGENGVGQDFDTDHEARQNLERKCSILVNVSSGKAVNDDGSIPGDGLGAGGLDSSFYSHLKRNWIWISYIINKTRKNKSGQDNGLTVRLQTFLNKHTLPLDAGGTKQYADRWIKLRGTDSPLSDPGAEDPNLQDVFSECRKDKITRKSVEMIKSTNGNQRTVFQQKYSKDSGELVQIIKEPTSQRNNRVCGGKSKKRKRPQKEVVAGKKKLKRKKSESSEQEKIKKNRYNDLADQSALQRMTRLRVAWTAQEDGLLMLCRIASSILNRKVKRPFVPWQVVRDIMHFSLEESLDKTSHSIGRRARYIMKNPQTYLNYKVCLAEVYQDKSVVAEFMNLKKNYDDPKVCAEEFKEFVEHLKQKFSTTLGQSICDIPDTLNGLFDRYHVLAVGDESHQESRTEILNSVDDIYILVLQNLILSTLALSDMQMKSCRSLQTFRMYREFRDDLLVKAFLEFQKKRMVNRRRGNQTMGPKKNRALPFVPMSFQLSQAYYRLFIWRFPSAICTESYQFLDTLKSFGSADQADVFTFSDQSTDTEEDMLSFPLDGPGGQCAMLLSLLLLGLISVHVKIPDQIVVVDSTLVDNEVMKSIGREGLDDEEYEEDEDETVSHKRKIEVKARQASHTNYLLMRGYCAPGIVSTRNLNPNDNVVVNSCQVRVKLRKTQFCGRLEQSGSSNNLAEDTPVLPQYFSELLNTKDCSIQSFLNHVKHEYSLADVDCVMEVYFNIKGFSYFGINMSDLGIKFSNLEEVQFGRTRDLQQYLQDLLTHRQVLKVGGASPRLVAMTYASPWILHSDGFKDIPTMQEKTELADCSQPLDNVIENYKTFLEPSTVNSSLKDCAIGSQSDVANSVIPVVSIKENRISENEEFDSGVTMEALHERESDCCFLGRPWRIVDGSLNKPVCKGMMEAVLYHIMSKPGITESHLLLHYSSVLQPLVVLELLQVLENIGCIKKYHIENTTKVSLFSDSVTPQLIKKLKLSEDATTFYEPSIDCTIKLGGIFPTEANWNKWVL
uniref:Ral transcription factor IIIC subunit 1 n=1 Tax=Leptobrachium leishanense TaxID=445787 RepID=A0A8C5QAQ7_9ANUR